MLGPEGPHPSHALILAARARAFRRELGAMAWAVLEDVATDAVSGVAATNARRVAANLGMGKDAAAHALARLVEAGVLLRVEQSRGGGRFSSGSYELRLPPGLLLPCPVAADTEVDQAERFAPGGSQGGRRRGRQGQRGDMSPGSAAPSLDRPARRARRAPAADSGQLSLLDVVGDDEPARGNVGERQRRRKPEAEDPEVRGPETEDPETRTPEAQDPEAQDPEAQDPEAQDPEAQDPEAQDPEAQDPEAQDPEAQDPENWTPEDFTPLHRRCDPGAAVVETPPPC